MERIPFTGAIKVETPAMYSERPKPIPFMRGPARRTVFFAIVLAGLSIGPLTYFGLYHIYRIVIRPLILDGLL